MPQSSPPAPARPAARRVKSIEVGFRLIRALEALDGYRPLKEIAAAAGMSASKAYLYLASFADEGLVHQNPETGHYGLGPFATQIGLSAIRQLDVVGLAREELAPLRQATACAAYVCVWGSRGPTIVLKVDGEYQGSMVVRIGYVLPLLRSSTGRVFLAWRAGAEADMVMAVDQMTSDPDDDPPDAGTLRQRMSMIVDTVRSRGYAFTDWDTVQEENLGVRYPINAGFAALSAPIFDYSGALAASLTLLGPQRLIGERRDHFAGLVTGAAGRVSARMGFSGPVPDAPPAEKSPPAKPARRSRKEVTEQPARAGTLRPGRKRRSAG
ncbi:IclR family transcriptional regulator [Marinibaculum pumilum]|uniref:IclR family transcriptional regulator n=1 Tax=Marinibaculum pumilum TaxID=1766165 RepID=A0ABV7L3E0_9PROT